MTMELVLFCTKGGGVPGLLQLQGLLGQLFRKERLEVFRTIPGLAARLRGPAEDLLVVVLVAADRRELEELVALRHLLGKGWVCLAVADEAPESLALAHRLRPRYLGGFEDAFAEVPFILEKMVQAHRRGPGGPQAVQGSL